MLAALQYRLAARELDQVLLERLGGLTSNAVERLAEVSGGEEPEVVLLRKRAGEEHPAAGIPIACGRAVVRLGDALLRTVDRPGHRCVDVANADVGPPLRQRGLGGQLAQQVGVVR